MFTQEYLKELFRYDQITGELFRLSSPKKPVGTIMGRGYMALTIDGEKAYVHRVIFILMGFNVSGLQVDHINGNKTDNRWVNLRLVKQEDNLRNKSLAKRNKTGVSGVSFYNNLIKKPWRVTFYEKGSKRSTDIFAPTLLDAACIRKSAENRLGYHENHGRKNN